MQAPVGKSNFKPTKEELGKIEKAFGDPKFRDLFKDYLDEISDPKRRAEIDAELVRMESQGQGPKNRKLMKPKAVWTLMLELTDSKGKLLINVCSGELCKDAKLGTVGKPKPDATGSFGPGLNWQIPYILGHARATQHSEEWATSYDIAFSNNTIETAKTQDSFKNLVFKTAIDGVNGLLKDCAVKDVKKWTVIEKPADEPAMMSVNVESVEKNDPSAEGMPTFGPKYQAIANPDGTPCPDYYVRMERESGGDRKVVVSVHLPGGNAKQMDVKVDHELRTLEVKFLKKFRIHLRVAFPFLKKYRVQWRKKQERCKVTFSIPNDFDGADQKYITKKSEAGGESKAKPLFEVPKAGNQPLFQLPNAGVTETRPLPPASPKKTDLRKIVTTLTRRDFAEPPKLMPLGEELSMFINEPDVIESSIEVMVKGDVLTVSLFKTPRDAIYSARVDLPFPVDPASLKVLANDKNVVIRLKRTFCGPCE